MKRLFPTFAALLATIGPVLADDLTGQASVIDGDTIEIHGTRIRLWGIDAPESTQLCRGEDSCSIDAARRQRTILTPSLLAGLSAAHPSHWINTGAPSRLAPWTALTLAIGSSATVSHSTGRIIPTACTIRTNERPSMQGAACGRAATSPRGCTGSASAPVECQPIVQMTRTHTLKCTRRRRSWAWRPADHHAANHFAIKGCRTSIRRSL
jgi:hypothetical protein